MDQQYLNSFDNIKNIMMQHILNNSRKVILLLLLMLPLSAAQRTNILFEWVRPMGGTAGDAGQKIVLDDTGNIYVAGSFSGTVDFDPGPGVNNLTSTASSDVFVSKYNASGTPVWTTKAGAAQSATLLTIDGTGNLYMIPWGGAITKLNNAGNIAWTKPMSFTYASDLTTDNAGNLYISGYFQGTVDFDPGPGVSNLIAATTGGQYNTFVLKLDTAGNFIWAKPVLSANNIQIQGILVGNDGKLYMTGAFSGIADFDPGTGTANVTAGTTPAAFIAKWNPDGSYIWAKTTQGSTAGTAEGARFSRHPFNNDIYLMGQFTGTVDFDPGPGVLHATSNGGNDVFILRMDTAATVTWVKRIGGAGLDNPSDIAVDTAGAVYTTGVFGNLNSDFDPGPGTELLPFAGGNRDIFVSKLDANGNYAWARSIGSAALDNGRSIAVDKNMNVYTTGSFQGTADFNTGTATPVTRTSAGGNDIFLHKFYQAVCTPTFSSLTAVGCETYFYNGQLYTTGGSYTQTFTNAAGCDSALTIELTITTPSIDTVFQTACDSFVFNGITYLQSGFYTETYVSSLNCDSTVTLALNLNAVNTQVTRVNNTLTAAATGAVYQWINCNGNVPVPGR